jgi:hypothetical protein
MLSGKGKHWVVFIISLLISAVISGQTGKKFKYRLKGDLNPVTIISGERSIIINYFSSELNITQLNNRDGDFFRISIPGHNEGSEPGKPELPVLSRLISVPENCDIAVRILNVKTEILSPTSIGFKGLLYPRQYSTVKQLQTQKPGFAIDKAIYAKRGLINTETVSIEMIGTTRSTKLANLCIFPIRYNPFLNQLEIITSMRVEIDFPPSKVTVPEKPSKGSALFSQSLSKGVTNWDPSDLITGYSDKPVRLVILTDTAFRKGLEPFIRWKTQKGFKVTSLYKGAGFTGTTFTQIKDSLLKIYNSATIENPAPEYLLIVGDINRIPRSEGTVYNSDLYWGEFDGGSDYLPEMYIGRLPVADTAELRTVVGKIVQYEKFEFADSNKFYSRALAQGGNDAGYADYVNGQLKYSVTNYLTPANKINEYHFYSPVAVGTKASLINLINNGLSFINYTGHGQPTGILLNSNNSSDTNNLYVSNLTRLKNKNMYPFIISNACQTARFDEASMGVKMMVSANKGAIGYIGCSADSYWDEDYFWAVGNGPISSDPKYSGKGLGALDRLFHTHGEPASEWYMTMGQINYAGNLAVSSSTSGLKKRYWETYTLLGDPSVIPYIGTPDTFKIALPDTLPNGIKSLSMTIDTFAYMAVSHFDTLWDASFASLSGNVVLDLPGKSNDSCLVVLTGQNKIPLIKKIYFSDINQEFINLEGTGINDAAGNNNGVADFGENFFLKVIISNLGITPASQLEAVLSTTSELVTILNNTVAIGNLPGKSQVVLSNNFELKINDLVPDKGYITLNLKLKDALTEKNFKIDISLHAPVLEMLNCTINDSSAGNGDLIADPGETVNLLFNISNSGSSNISGLVNITNTPSGITINQPSVLTGIIMPGEVKAVPITITLSPSLAKGSTFDINAILDCSPYIQNKSFSIPVGKTLESFEYQSFKIFPWDNSSAHPWLITDQWAYNGHFSARSAVISNNTLSTLKLTVNTPVKDTVRFFYKVSSEPDWDFLIFRINSKEIFRTSGEKDWTGYKIGINEGLNHLEWIYSKDNSVSVGSDCAWLDYISFPVSAYNRFDLKTGKIITPQPNKSYSHEQITTQVINFGTDTVTGFNLAYKVNENSSVSEHFSKLINPGDTISVSFSVQADLTGNGTYNILVYGFNNNDSFLANDTSKLALVNTAITPVENPENKVKINPNPFSVYFRVKIDSDSADDLRLTIYNTSGKLVFEETDNVVPGENIFTVSPGNLPSGFYSLKIQGKSILKAARIVKIR